MEQITTLNYCPNWKKFLFCHQDKPKYKVLLPDEGELLYLSSYTIYNLRKGESSLCSTTRTQCKEGNADNVFDLSKSEYSSTEIIEFFFLVTFPEDVSFVIDPSDSIMLMHIYAPKMMEEVLSFIDVQIPGTNTTKDQLHYFWKMVRLYELAERNFSDVGRYSITLLLKRYPHTLWQFDNTIDIDRFIVRQPKPGYSGYNSYGEDEEEDIEYDDLKNINPELFKVIECWKRGDKNSLYEIEEKPEIKSLMITNEEGVSLLRIATVAQKLNLALNKDQLMSCGKFVESVYINKRGNRPSKVKCNIDNKIVSINHYDQHDYDIIVEGINSFQKNKN